LREVVGAKFGFGGDMARNFVVEVEKIGGGEGDGDAEGEGCEFDDGGDHGEAGETVDIFMRKERT
jgi:hypothetical protein